MSPEYAIKTVTDFAKVPDHRLDACLVEFKDFIERVKDAEKDIATIDPTGTMMKLANEHVSFTWRDDGKRGVSVRLRIYTEDMNDD